MPHHDDKSTDFRELRKQAERIIENREAGPVDADDHDLFRLIYELEVREVELSLQNEELRQSAKELEAARNEYFNLYDGAPVGFMTIDRQGRIERCNQAAAGLLGNDQKQLTGRLFSSRIFREDQKIFFFYLKSLVDAKRAAPDELRLVRPDGEIHAHFQAVAKRTPEGAFTHWHLALIDITERITIEKELQQRAHQLSRLAGELVLAEQRERRRLAEVLHDDLQQLLAGARLHLEILSGVDGMAQNPAYRSAFDLVVKSIKTSRSLTSELSPPVLFRKGLVEALKWLARWMEKTHRLDVDLYLDESCPMIPEELRLLLFQSVRELLFNIVKHARTNTARLEMKCSDAHVRIVVSDLGAGSDNAEIKDYDKPMEGGFGLSTIKERIKLLGRDFRMASTPGYGTTITLTAPLKGFHGSL